MEFPLVPISSLSDEALIERLKGLVAIERRATALTLSHLIEFDHRRLFADLGLPSLFAYCVRELGYSEGAAYKRIQAARAARQFPTILDMLEDGRLSLAAAVILAPHLTPENQAKLLEMAIGQSSRGVEALIARLAPRPDAKDCLRRLGREAPKSEDPDVLPLLSAPLTEKIPAPEPPYPSPQNPSRRSRPEPLSEERFLFRFTGSGEFRDKFERARAFLRLHPSSDGMASIFEKALDALLKRIDPLQRHERRQARLNAEARPGDRTASARSRVIPRPIRDAVWSRDGGQCTFVGTNGKRCPEIAELELDHIVPWAAGGSSTDPQNLRLACRQHNQLFARRFFGAAAVRDAIRRRRGR